MKPDLTYRTTGLFTRFTAESNDGALAWYSIGPNGTVLTQQLASVLRQLREAGYKVAELAA